MKTLHFMCHIKGAVGSQGWWLLNWLYHSFWRLTTTSPPVPVLDRIFSECSIANLTWKYNSLKYVWKAQRLSSGTDSLGILFLHLCCTFTSVCILWLHFHARPNKGGCSNVWKHIIFDVARNFLVFHYNREGSKLRLTKSVVCIGLVFIVCNPILFLLLAKHMCTQQVIQ